MIIKKKDMEIAFLTEKLNINGISIQPTAFNGLNQMNMNNNLFLMNNMMINSNKDISNRGKEICVNYENIKTLNCFENDLACKLLAKIEPTGNWYLLKYTIDGKKILPFISIGENGIKEGSLIKCNRVINIKFLSIENSIKIIYLDEDYPIKKAIKYYLMRIGKEGYYDEFYFIYGEKVLNINDKAPIKDLIKSADSNIKVRSK